MQVYKDVLGISIMQTSILYKVVLHMRKPCANSTKCEDMTMYIRGNNDVDCIVIVLQLMSSAVCMFVVVVVVRQTFP